MRFLLRLGVIAAALWTAVRLVPGITYEGHWAGLLGVAVVFGTANATIRPILAVLTCPLVFLTLGLFILVLNGFMLLLTSIVAELLGLEFFVATLWDGFLGALVVSIVSALLNTFVADVEGSD